MSMVGGCEYIRMCVVSLVYAHVCVCVQVHVCGGCTYVSVYDQRC